MALSRWEEGAWSRCQKNELTEMNRCLAAEILMFRQTTAEEAAADPKFLPADGRPLREAEKTFPPKDELLLVQTSFHPGMLLRAGMILQIRHGLRKIPPGDARGTLLDRPETPRACREILLSRAREIHLACRREERLVPHEIRLSRGIVRARAD